jgi:hypothetical protein
VFEYNRRHPSQDELQKHVNTMTTNHLMTGEEYVPETSRTPTGPQDWAMAKTIDITKKTRQ